MSDILLITPPFTQLNTPYPATAYIKGFLNTKGIASYQVDLGIEVILRLFTQEKLTEVFAVAAEKASNFSENAQRIFALKEEYLLTVEEVILFLQGKNPNLARQICTENYLPQASRFTEENDLHRAFGTMGLQDKAKHLATLYLEDLSDFIQECVDENFGFSRYAERLGRSANSFDELFKAVISKRTFIDKLSLEIFEEYLEDLNPSLVCFSVPFPGNLYSAFRCASHIKKFFPDIKTAMGGGFANTELRSVKDERVFYFFNYITLDDGELPLEIIISNIFNPREDNPNHGLYKRTFLIDTDNGNVLYNNFSLRKDYKQSEVGTPDYSDLPLDSYISVIETANPMHSLWSDGRWNKLTMAHGCYWGKCTFCDVSLPYIKDYEPVAAAQLADRMETLIAQTGEKGFHFVDEAAPPALMRALAIEIIKRKLSVTWWTNIRFEKRFTRDLCRLLKASGCIAVSGGLEVASDRLLEVIKKGVTVAQVARVTRNFTEAGIMTHAYLMYGYPTQTVQETVDSLEMVRQLFELGIIQSGFWHQFALTTHSPVGLDPEAYGIIPEYQKISFADNDVQFKDSTGIDHEQFSYGLKKSLYNYMHGIGFEFDLQEWFDFAVPNSLIAPDYIQSCLETEEDSEPKDNTKLFFTAPLPVKEYFTEEGEDLVLLSFHNKIMSREVVLGRDLGDWLYVQLNTMKENTVLFKNFKESFEEEFAEIDALWQSEEMDTIREIGLLTL